MHLRLVVPVKRSVHPPHYTARGVMIGVFWAFTPLIGIQMYLVLLTWLVSRKRPEWEFSLLVALAWTWVTNVATLVPTYYVFYITGLLLMGQPSLSAGYDNFAEAWEAALEVEGWLNGIAAWAKVIWTEQGLPMFVGCLPYAIGGGFLGYKLSLAYIIRLRRIKAKRRMRLRSAALQKSAADPQ